MADTIRPNIDSREAFSQEEEIAYQAYLEDGGNVTNEDYEEMCDYFDSLDEDDYEDDGQPDEQQEWDDLYGYGPEFDSYDGYDEY